MYFSGNGGQQPTPRYGEFRVAPSGVHWGLFFSPEFGLPFRYCLFFRAHCGCDLGGFGNLSVSCFKVASHIRPNPGTRGRKVTHMKHKNAQASRNLTHGDSESGGTIWCRPEALKARFTRLKSASNRFKRWNLWSKRKPMWKLFHSLRLLHVWTGP